MVAAKPTGVKSVPKSHQVPEAEEPKVVHEKSIDRKSHPNLFNLVTDVH
eukprot:CAMPEP_0170454434 /NCGR_PEP_ID=MMETSP0123-20130129/2686_1 /TAXON_ID=182087 /ORGANISM="Favella ehrenbergii, Strain Fehren 1" /LENGTH=48 /DNA_ID= /DNA_START= /DNA_END= /DNA_ORIENTATION=